MRASTSLRRITLALLLFLLTIRSFGATKLIWEIEVPARYDLSHAREAQVAFLDEDTIGFSFVQEAGNRTVFDILFIDLRSGKVREAKSWEVARPRSDAGLFASTSGRAYFFPTIGGEYLVSNGAELDRYSAKGELLQKEPIESRTELFLSPNHELLLLKDFVRSNESRLAVVSTPDIRQRRVLDWNGHYAVGIANTGEILIDQVVFPGVTKLKEKFPQKDPSVPQVISAEELRETVGQATTLRICRDASSCQTIIDSAPKHVYVRFINDNLLLIGGVSDWRVENRRGEALFTRRFSVKNESWSSDLSVSDRGGKFAVSSSYIAPNSWVERIEIFDIEKRRISDSFKLMRARKSGVDKREPVREALAPDGNSIVILHGSELKYYALSQ